MTEHRQPNIVLIMTDQQRGDCLGLAGHPVLQTPFLDSVGAGGTRFSRCYSACPVCVPARRTLMTGQKPATHGVLHNYHTWLRGPTLAEELQKAGYQTMLSGKLHLWPYRKRYGFEGFKLADGPGGGDTDYIRFLRREGVKGLHPDSAHGMTGNSLRVRPWQLEERYHVANWATDEAIEFVETRDPTRPFFLKLSFFHPHGPITPPAYYLDLYMNMDLPDPIDADWSRQYDAPRYGDATNHVVAARGTAPLKTRLPEAVRRQFQAAYYGAIHHIDDQVQRFVNALELQQGLTQRETVFLFTSDHGDMCGDHQLYAKCQPYDGAARVPLLVRLPQSWNAPQRQVVDAPVELMDIMPTILDIAGAPIPETVDGTSLLPFLRGETPAWREFVHGEIARVSHLNSGMQYLTDGKRKYCWFPGIGLEQFFDLENDPRETVDLARDSSRAREIEIWRQRLVRELDGRPEGFTDGTRLLELPGPTPRMLPGFENDARAATGDKRR